MRLTIVRHGETVENIKDISQGQRFGTLSENGKEQAKKLALRLKDEKFDIIYCSDLERAKDTCTEILKFHPDVPVVYAEEVRERSKGEFEGKHHSLINEFYDLPGTDFFRAVPPGGESRDQLIERVNRFFDMIAEKHKGQKVLLVTHGEVIVTLIHRVLKLGKTRHTPHVPGNTAVTVIEVDDNGEHKAHLVNCVAHL